MSCEVEETTRKKTEEVLALDLSFLEQRLSSKLKWSDSKIKNTIRRYKNFLILRYKYPEPLGPTEDIDEVWHAHILHTTEYFRDCKAIFGYYIHHNPFNEVGNKEAEAGMDKIYYRTSELYIQEFQEPYSLNLDISTFW